MSDPFDRLTEVLDRIAANGGTARFWLRDDDAVAPSPSLERLVALSADHSIPATLAVIPAATDTALVAFLAPAPQISIAVHGWAHQNHASAAEKKQELGPHRPLNTVLGELSAGLEKLGRLHGARLIPMLVPPWNRIDARITAALPGIGFHALSVFGPEQPAPIPMLNTHVDLIDWRGNRGGRPEADLVTDTIAALQSGVSDVGLLTHHLVHDRAAWDFLDRFLALTSTHPACKWRAPGEILRARQSGIV